MRSLMLCCCLLTAFYGRAQTLPVFQSLNAERIATNRTGMTVLGAWGVANVAEGIAGYGLAQDETWRSFHQMNAVWGIVNTGIAVSGYLGARREAGKSYSFAAALHRYESGKRLFLLNAGLDCVYIGTGIFMTEQLAHRNSHSERWEGYGRSFIFQGAGLLLFDAIMFTAHQSRDRRWYRLLQGVSFSGSGIGLRCRI